MTLALSTETLTIANAPARAAAFLETVSPYPNTFAGRGIVICAGGVRYLTCAWVLVNMLRRVGCTLPIEVWYRGEEERDPNWIRLVEPLGVRCVDACEVSRSLPNPHPRLGGWESKAFAILHCRFEEVLLLDADNVPAVDPTFLFELPEYLATGAIFWPDCNRSGIERDCWKVFDVSYRDEWEQESGQIVIDKRRSQTPLCLCDWYNRNSDFFYRHVFGDKDTFRLAWHRAGQPYAMPEKIKWDSIWICQPDFNGNLLFQHRQGDKWSLAGNRRCAGFQHEEICFALVRELADRWNPLLHLLRHLTQADSADMAECAKHHYHFSLVGRRRFPITLQPQGMVVGSGPIERFWWCESGRLVFSKFDGSPPLVMERRSPGQWQGRSQNYGGIEIRLAKTRFHRTRSAIRSRL